MPLRYAIIKNPARSQKKGWAPLLWEMRYDNKSQGLTRITITNKNIEQLEFNISLLLRLPLGLI
jgi:hypothetical protein